MIRNISIPKCSTAWFLVIFLALLIVCTIFTSTIMNSHGSDFIKKPEIRGVLQRLLMSANSDNLKDVNKTDYDQNFGAKNDLDGCFHVYLDVGSNVGIQVRKLFEPKLYPDAQVLPVFDKYFGPISTNGQRDNTVCAIGFEPNAHHTKALKDIEQAHKACGWRSHFYTETAAAHNYGTISFLSDNDLGNLEWGGSIVADQRNSQGKIVGAVKKMRLADFVLERVMTRQIPEAVTSDFPSVLMKVDIEGSELEVLTDMLVSGALQHVNYTFAEFHPHSFKADEKRSIWISELKKMTDWLTQVTKELGLKSQIKLDTVDDESYYTSKFTLPVC